MATRTKAKAVKPKTKSSGNSKASSSRGRKPKGLNLKELSAAEQKKLASQIKALRRDKTPWDGDGGICDQLGLGSALQGRALLRKYGGEGMIREQTGNGTVKKTPPKTVSKGKAGAKKKITVRRGSGKKAANPS